MKQRYGRSDSSGNNPFNRVLLREKAIWLILGWIGQIWWMFKEGYLRLLWVLVTNQISNHTYLQQLQIVRYSSLFHNNLAMNQSSVLIIALFILTAHSQFTNPGCSVFNATQCVSCHQRYFLLGGICFPVNPLCQGYNNTNGNCLSCYEGFLLSAHTCIPVPIIPHCSRYAQDGNCSQCADRYYLSSDKQCLSVSYLCDTYALDGNCTSCILGYIFYQRQCIKIIDNCSQQSGVVCVSCKPNYFLKNNSCLQLTQNCLSYNNGVCSQCQDNYFLQNATCFPPIDNCTRYSQGECIDCQSYFDLVEGYCIPTIDPFCSTFNGTECLNCSQGYFFNDKGRCIVMDPLCQSYTAKGICLSCYNGFAMMDGKCRVIKEALDPYCYEFNGTQCLKCSKGYRFNSSRACIAQDYLCKSYDPVTFTCQVCYPGFMVGDSGRCEIITEPGCITWLNKSCSLCSEGFYLFAGHCNQIDSLCSKFNYTSLKCMSCYLGYILINDKCQTIPKANPLYNCAKISPENKCLTCYFGFYLSGGECKIVDPLCRTFDSGSGACTSCYSGYFLLRRQGKCIYVG